MPLDNINRDNRVTLRYWKNYKTTVNSNEKGVGHVALEVYGQYPFYASFWPEHPAGLFDRLGVPGKWRRSYQEDKLAEATGADSLERRLPERADVSIDLYSLDTLAMHKAYLKMFRSGLRYAAPGSTVLALPFTANCCTVVDSLLKTGGIEKLYIENVNSYFSVLLGITNKFLANFLELFGPTLTLSVTNIITQKIFSDFFVKMDISNIGFSNPKACGGVFLIGVLMTMYKDYDNWLVNTVVTNGIALFFQYMQMPASIMMELPNYLNKSFLAKPTRFLINKSIEFNSKVDLKNFITGYFLFKKNSGDVAAHRLVKENILPLWPKLSFEQFEHIMKSGEKDLNFNDFYLFYAGINSLLTLITWKSAKILNNTRKLVTSKILITPQDILHEVESAKFKEKLYYKPITPKTDSFDATAFLTLVQKTSKGIFHIDKSSVSKNQHSYANLVKNNSRICGGLFLFQSSVFDDRKLYSETNKLYESPEFLY